MFWIAPINFQRSSRLLCLSPAFLNAFYCTSLAPLQLTSAPVAGLLHHQFHLARRHAGHIAVGESLPFLKRDTAQLRIVQIVQVMGRQAGDAAEGVLLPDLVF